MQGEKLVIDTNVWISYFLGGKTTNLTKAILDFELEVFTNQQLIAELKDVLQRPKLCKLLKLPISSYLDIHQSLTIYCTEPFERVEGIPDTKDEFLFALGIKKKANYLITGDQGLCDLKVFQSIKIITWKEFRLMTNQP